MPSMLRRVVFLCGPALSCGPTEPVGTPAGQPGQPPASMAQGAAESAPDPQGLDPALPGPHLLILGTAQDGGIPYAACSCGRCQAAREGRHRARYVASVALVLPDLEEVYLFDATPDIREQLAMLADADEPSGRVDRRPVNGIFLTHAHIGHYLGLAFFGFEAVHTRDLPVYGTPAMMKFLESNAPWEQLLKIGNLAAMPTDPGHPVTLGSVTVTSMRVPHRDEYADTVAYVFQGPSHRAIYIPDADAWRDWEQSVDELFAGADEILVDATFYSADELPGRSIEDIGHPVMTASMDRWQADVQSGKRSVRFTHLNHSNLALDPTGPPALEVANRGFEILREGRRIAL